MKRGLSFLIISLLMFICAEILTESQSIIDSVSFSLSIWKNNIFPSLFPFFVLSEIMVKYGMTEFIGNLLNPIMTKLFKIKPAAAFVLVMSLISGNPANAKYTRELYLNGDLNQNEATKILCFSCFANPLFILGTVALLFLNNKEVGILILLCHYIGNFIIGLCLRNYYPSENVNTKISLKKAINEAHQKISNKEDFGKIITGSLLNSINTLLLILGVMTMCLVITTIIDNNINLNSVLQSLLNGSIEMTQGLKYISLEAIPLKLKCVLSVMILSFGGLSVHMQITSILSDTKIKYLPFLLSRIIHSLISGLLMFIFFDMGINFFN